MVAQIILKSNKSASSAADSICKFPTVAGKRKQGYVKGNAPSEKARWCENEFKSLTFEMKEFKVPSFMKFNSNYFWSKIAKIEDQKLKGQCEFMLDSIQQGMQNSHPDVNLKDCKLEEVFDFVLSVDHTLYFNSPKFKGSELFGFDVTTNLYGVENKVNKIHIAYRGAKRKLLEEFGFKGYIIILWSVKGHDYDKHDIQQQLLKGLANWRPKEFTHVIELK